MTKNKLFLLGIPFLNAGVVFSENELASHVETLKKEIKALLPELSDFDQVDIAHEILVGENHLILNLYLTDASQLGLEFFKRENILEVKELLIEALKLLPLKLNLVNLKNQSVNSDAFEAPELDDKNLKKIIRKRQKTIMKFLLEGDDVLLSFPEMAPYYVDSEVREIAFKIEYLHAKHLKIKLLSEDLGANKKNKSYHLMTQAKFRDDQFFNLCTDALRPNKKLSCKVVTFIDNLTHNILAFEAV